MHLQHGTHFMWCILIQTFLQQDKLFLNITDSRFKTFYFSINAIRSDQIMGSLQTDVSEQMRFTNRNFLTDTNPMNAERHELLPLTKLIGD